MAHPPRKPVAVDHIHRAEDVYAPGEGDQEALPSAIIDLVFRQLGPYPVAFDTPDLMNPVNFGADVGIVPAGSLFQIFAVVTTNWNQAGELAVVVSEDGVDGPNRVAAAYTSVAAATIGSSGFMERFRESAQTPSWGVASADLHIVVGFFPDAADPTTGAADIYAIVASPAS